MNIIFFFFLCELFKICENGEICNFFICGDYFLLFKEFFLVNNIGYDFCLLNILRFKIDREKGNN